MTVEGGGRGHTEEAGSAGLVTLGGQGSSGSNSEVTIVVWVRCPPSEVGQAGEAVSLLWTFADPRWKRLVTVRMREQKSRKQGWAGEFSASWGQGWVRAFWAIW